MLRLRLEMKHLHAAMKHLRLEMKHLECRSVLPAVLTYAGAGKNEGRKLTSVPRFNLRLLSQLTAVRR